MSSEENMVALPLVLASGSSYRKEQMGFLGLAFIAVEPPYKETHDLGLLPEKLVVHLALQKAESVSRLHPEALIVAADQVLVMDQRIFTKPGTKEEARKQLEELSGRKALLMTALGVLGPGKRWEWDMDVVELCLQRLEEAVIERYIEQEKPFDCVGALKLEGMGRILLRSSTTADLSAIIGLPLAKLVDLLKKFSIRKERCQKH